MVVCTIRHKLRKSYKYEENFKIDVSDVRMVDAQHELFKIENETGIQQPVFDKQKTEVEVTYCSLFFVLFQDIFDPQQCYEDKEER